MVIPLYNHGATLRDVVVKALEAGWPVLVVDDGSTDGGAATVVDLDCQVVSLGENRGKGAAIVAGAAEAEKQGYDAIITVDADGQLDPAEAHLLAAEAQENWPSIVIGARKMDRDSAPGASIFGRAFSNFWVRLECGRNLADTQSGFRLYPVSCLLQLPMRRRRYDFEVEVLVRAAWAGIPIFSTPVSVYYPKGDERITHFHQVKDNFRLTLLHTGLVIRSLVPWPHQRLFPKPPREEEAVWVLHPVKLVKRLCKEHSSPLALAAAVWMGFFLGALPLIAVHTVVIIYVTRRLHLNTLAAVGASQFCCPPVVPVLCILTGNFMRTGNFFMEISRETIILQIHERLWEWLLGSMVVGPVLGLIGGGITYFGIRALRRRSYP